MTEPPMRWQDIVEYSEFHDLLAMRLYPTPVGSHGSGETTEPSITDRAPIPSQADF
jgi:hypothetical protein